MALPAVWIERRFEFPFNADVYPSVLMRLRGTPARLEELLAGAPDEALRRRPAEGKWSPLEHSGHLVTIERLWDLRVTDFLSGAGVLAAADMSNAATFEADWNAVEAAAVPRRFREARRATLARLDTLAADDFSRTALHPRLGVPMRLVDALYFVAEHDDHELAWIFELLRTGG